MCDRESVCVQRSKIESVCVIKRERERERERSYARVYVSTIEKECVSIKKMESVCV